jgi:hypothetical protein
VTARLPGSSRSPDYTAPVLQTPTSRMLARAYVATATALSLAALTGCAGAQEPPAAAPPAGAASSSAPAKAGSTSAAAPVQASSGAPLTAAPRTGGVAGRTTVTITGTDLAAVQKVRFGTTTVTPSTRSATKLTVKAPPAKDFKAATVRVALVRAGGTTAAGSYRYVVRSGLDRQLRYVLTYWKHYNPAYEPLDDNDCVDFASQSLLQRGWKEQGAWTHAEAVLDSGLAWRSSTALRDFLAARPQLATPLTDQQRAKVKLGDIVQFDWDRSGDRDHTGVVTRIVHTSSAIKIYFAGHTRDSAYRNVDTAITKDHPGGVAYYWSVK